MSEKLWAGRFTQPTDAFVEEFTASINFDQRLYRYDILGSITHARMLARQGIIADDEAETIVTGLNEILAEIEAGQFSFSVAREDIHMNIEARLIEKIGSVGGKLHTARSRNDQVALDVRFYLRDEVDAISAALKTLQSGPARSGRSQSRCHHAGLHPPADRSAGPLRPSHARLRGDAGQGHRPPPRSAQPAESAAARRRRPGGDNLPHRSRVGG